MDDYNVKARTLRVRNGMSLVEWVDENSVPQRTWVTEDMIVQRDGQNVVVSTPSAGMPYGVPFGQIVSFSPDPNVFERELKRQGIWTAEEARANMGAVRNALQSASGIDTSAVLRALERYEKELTEA